MEIAVVGAGHVGLVTAGCFAALGRQVRVFDIDAGRIERLGAGETPFFEPDLDEVLARARASGSICFSADAKEALHGAQVIFLCVDTPNRADGQVDLGAVVSATDLVVRYASAPAVVVNRSTAPVGTAEFIRSSMEDHRDGEVTVAVNPEFLAEGSAVPDFLAPDRVVIGAWERKVSDLVRGAYEPILSRRLPAWLPKQVHDRGTKSSHEVPLIVTRPATAELIKYAANAFLAVKLSFINEIAQIAEEVGGDVTEVARAIGLDRRIGPHFLHAGIGWGGSCFPKDIVALQGMAETRGLAGRMIRAANEVNVEQQSWVIRNLQRHLKTMVGRRVAFLGLTYKPNTDDLRNAPAVDVAKKLASMSVRVRAFDPAVERVSPDMEGIVELGSDAYAAAQGTEAVLLFTEWPEFAGLDLAQLRRGMRGDLMIDGRNFFDPSEARGAGFRYVGVGR